MSRSPDRMNIQLPMNTPPIDPDASSVINTHSLNHHSPLQVPARSPSDKYLSSSAAKRKLKIKWPYVKTALILIAYFTVFYGILCLIFLGLLVALLEDTETTLIIFGIIWLVTVAIIIGMVIYGMKTDQLTKYANKVKRSKQSPEEEHLSPQEDNSEIEDLE